MKRSLTSENLGDAEMNKTNVPLLIIIMFIDTILMLGVLSPLLHQGYITASSYFILGIVVSSALLYMYTRLNKRKEPKIKRKEDFPSI